MFAICHCHSRLFNDTHAEEVFLKLIYFFEAKLAEYISKDRQQISLFGDHFRYKACNVQLLQNFLAVVKAIYHYHFISSKISH